jgi:hypothetical protein
MSNSVLQGILKANDSMVSAAANVQKRQKTQGGASPYFETVAMKLLEVQRDLRKNYDDSRLEVIEVEVILTGDV